MKLNRRQLSLGSLAAAVLAPLGLWKAKAKWDYQGTMTPVRKVVMPMGTTFYLDENGGCYYLEQGKTVGPVHTRPA